MKFKKDKLYAINYPATQQNGNKSINYIVKCLKNYQKDPYLIQCKIIYSNFSIYPAGTITKFQVKDGHPKYHWRIVNAEINEL